MTELAQQVDTLSPPAAPNKLLIQILRTKRAHGSAGDTNFRLWLTAHIQSLGYSPTLLAEGCIFVTTDAKSDTLFSAHVDTCHGKAESDGSYQDISYDPIMGHIFLSKESKSACLGADDGAGIYILLKMLEAKVPGGYLFAVGEEVGGIGCRAVLAKHKDVLENYSRAVAFDRAGTHEVVCTQGGRVCASIVAGQALATALSTGDLDYEVSHKGTFTDTKVYADVIEECFNIGVGYYDQHSPNEQQDVAHLEALLAVALKVKWDDLPVVRKATADVSATYQYKKQPTFADWERQQRLLEPALPKAVPKALLPVKSNSVSAIVLDEMPEYTAAEYIDVVESDPELAGSLMMYLFARNQALQAELASLNVMLGID